MSGKVWVELSYKQLDNLLSNRVSFMQPVIDYIRDNVRDNCEEPCDGRWEDCQYNPANQS